MRLSGLVSIRSFSRLCTGLAVECAQRDFESSPNTRTGITQVSPTGDSATRRYPQPGMPAFFGEAKLDFMFRFMASEFRGASG